MAWGWGRLRGTLEKLLVCLKIRALQTAWLLRQQKLFVWRSKVYLQTLVQNPYVSRANRAPLWWLETRTWVTVIKQTAGTFIWDSDSVKWHQIGDSGIIRSSLGWHFWVRTEAAHHSRWKYCISVRVPTEEGELPHLKLNMQILLSVLT